MAITVVELLILIITDFYHAILSSECVAIIISHFMVKNFYDPVVEVFTVEKFDPIFFG